MLQGFANRFTSMQVFVFVIFFLGCTPKPSSNRNKTQTPETSPPLKLLVMDDQPLCDAIGREWEAGFGEKIVCTNIVGSPLEATNPKEFDVFIVPPVFIGDLASAGLIRPIPKASLALCGFDDLFRMLRTKELSWGKQTGYGVSIGSPQFVLFYRADVFQQLKMTPPTSWKDYQQTVDELAAAIAESTIDVRLPTAEPVGELWAGKLFLARAAAYARNSSQYSCLFHYLTLKPLIDQPPFVRALDELRAVQIKSSDSRFQTPDDVANAFVKGQLAMAITWPSAARVHEESAIEPAVAPIPGSRQTFHFSENVWMNRTELQSIPLLGVSGRIAVVGKYGTNLGNSLDFVAWLSNNEQTRLVTNRSLATTVFRQSQKKLVANWVDRPLRRMADPYFDVVSSNHRQPTFLMAPRLNGHERYLEVLDRQIRNSFESDQPSTEILRLVAQKWEEITEELNRKQQIQSYLRSLGISD